MTVELKPIPEEQPDPIPVVSDGPAEAVEPVKETEPAQPEPAVEEQQAAVPKQRPKRGRPPGSKNKAPRKQTVTLVEQPDVRQEHQEVKEETYVEPPPPPSPRTQKRMYLQEMSKRKAELNAMKVRHYSTLLDDMFSY